MPQFRWRGVTIEGKWHGGRSCAISPVHFEARMLSRGIAITHITSARPSFFRFKASFIEQAQSLETLGLLLDSGMRLYEACLVTAETVINPILQELWIEIARLIEEGKEFEQSTMLPTVFAPLISHLLRVSYRAGALSATAKLCAHYARALHDLKSKLRSALMMPLITLAFVGILLWIIFVFLVPSLTTLFNQFNAELPLSTKVMLQISVFAQNPWCMGLLGLGFLLLYAVLRYAYARGTALWIYLPFIGPLYLQWQRIVFTQSLYALLDGGVAVHDAVPVLAQITSSPLLRNYATRVAHMIDGGMPLSDAIAITDLSLATPLMIAMVTVGQESNNLARTLESFAQREMNDFLARLQTMTMLIQPMLIIMLGFIVLAVIGAVYMPLINIAHVVQ